MTSPSLAGPLSAARLDPARVAVRGVEILALAFLVWAFVPVLTAAHFEAVSFNTTNLSLRPFWGTVLDLNPRQPLAAEFVFATRAGAVAFIRALNPLTGSPDLSYRILVVASTLVFLATLWRAARTWLAETVPNWAILVALALLPNVVELGYSLNDNIVSVALATLAVALLARRPEAAPRPLVVYALAGLAFGLAVSTRIDSLLVAPALLALAVIDRPHRGLLPALAMAGLWFGLATMNMAALTGYTPLASAIVTAQFGFTNHFGEYWLVQRLGVFLIAVGPIALVLWLRGVFALRRAREPALVLAALVGLAVIGLGVLSAKVPRYIYPIGYVFLVPIVALGLAQIRSWTGRTLLAACTLAALFASDGAYMYDGPRAIFGRAYTAYQTRLWQRSFETTQRRYAAELDAAEARPGKTLFLTQFYNEEYLLKYRLRQRGYHELPPDGGPCDAVARYVKGERVIPIVPVDKTYSRVPGSNDLIWAVSLLEAERCPAAQDAAVTVSGVDLNGRRLQSYDAVQVATLKDRVTNRPMKQPVIPFHQGPEDRAVRRARACEIATVELGSCDAPVVHARYQEYIQAYALKPIGWWPERRP